MAKIELKGLQGFNSLPKEDQEEFLNLNPELKRKPTHIIDRAYKNGLFVQRLGRELYNSLPNPADRDKVYEESVVKEGIIERYKDSKDFSIGENGIINTPEGTIVSIPAMKFLLENDYKTSEEMEALTKEKQAQAAATVNAGNAFTPLSARSAMAAGERIEEKISDKDNKHILEQALKIDNEALSLREDIQEYTVQNRENLLGALQEGEGQAVSDEFDKILSTKDPGTGQPLFPIYQAYKDSYQIQDLSDYEKVDFISKFNALRQAAENTNSEAEQRLLFDKTLSIINDDLKHKIYEETTTLDNIGKTLEMVGTKAYSNLGLVPNTAEALYLFLTDKDAYNNFIMGKDKQGNQLPWWNNIQYFTDVDQYNVWTTEDINKIKQNGGISENTILRDVGEEYDWFNAASLYEGIGMMGYMASSIGVDLLLTGGAGSLLKAGGKGAMKGLLRAGVSPRTLVTMRRVFDNPAVDALSDMARLNIHSFGESGMEAASAAQETYYQALQDQGTEENQARIQARVEQSVQEQLNREFPNGSDRFVSLPDGQGKVSARMLRAEQLRNEYTKQYTEDVAVEAAGAAFAAQATAMQLKNTLMDAVFKTYMFAKPFKTKIRPGNYPDWSLTTVLSDGTLKAKDYTWKQFAKDAAKTHLGGGIEEITDNMVHTGAVELGLNYHNNYLKHLYNGDTYAKADLMNGAALAWLTGTEDALYDEGTYLEGFIGAISPGITGSVSTRALKYLGPNRQQNIEALKKMSTLQKINEFIYHPLIQNALDTENQYRQNQTVVEAVNSVIQNHGEDYKDVIKGINLVEQFHDIRTNGETVDAKDSKFNLAFEFIRHLNTLAQAGEKSPLYRDYVQMLEKAANGEIDNETVAAYLAQPENRNLISEQGQEAATASAIENIQKNANQIFKLAEEYQRTKEAVESFTQGKIDNEAVDQLVYQTMVSSNWESRISEMEQTLTGKPSTGRLVEEGQLNEYGSKETEKQLKDTLRIFDAFKEKGTLKGRLKTLQKRAKKALDSFSEIQTDENGIRGRVLSAEEILNLDPVQRRKMLENHNFYTEEQVVEIERAENMLAQRDPNYRSKVKDVAILSERLKQNNESYKNLLDNPESLMQYKQTIAVQAISDAVDVMRRAQIEATLKDLDKKANRSNKQLVNFAKQLSAESLKTVISARPQYKGLLSPYIDRAETIDTLAKTVDGLDVSEVQKSALKDALNNLVAGANTTQEIIDSIEDFIDNAGDSEAAITLREQMNEILDRAVDNNIVRNAAKVEARGNSLEKARKYRERKDRKNELARERRARKKAEVQRKAEEEAAKEKAKGMNGKIEDTTKPGTIQIAEEEEIPGFEYTPKIEEVTTPPVVEETPTIEPEEIVGADETLEPTADTSDAIQLRGNTLSPYNANELQEGVIKPKEVTGWLKDFYDWLSNAGIKLQEIIDYELAGIAKLNPTVHYMRVNPAGEATNDDVNKRHAFLVVEATNAVKKLHNKDRGGIITANGKEWLIVGTMGYAPNSNEQALWKQTLDKLAMRADAYFKHNPSERFEVDEKFETSIKQLALGRLINQLAEDSEVTFRSISELLADPNRNPYGLQWKDLSFAIQMATGGFELSKSVSGDVYAPKRFEENAGNVFLMIKAANGNYIPAAIRPTFTDELKPGTLQTTINDLLMQLLTPDHKVRFDAISQLKFLLNLNDNDNILIGKEDLNIVSIKQNGVIVDTINLDAENFDRAVAFEKLKAGRFRIQITRNNLIDIDRLKELDEAGALQTDIALLATAGGHYTIFASDMETGKPIDQNPLHTSSNSVTRGSALNMSKDPAQIVDGKVVRFHNGVWVNEAGKQVTDPAELQKIDMLNNIEANNIPVAYKDKQGYNIYIISTASDTPVAARVDKSHNITIYTGRNAQNAIDHYNSLQKPKVEEIDLGINEIVEEDKQKPVATQQEVTTPITKKETVSKEKTKESKKFVEVSNENSSKDLHNSKNLLTFVNIVTNPQFGAETRKAFVQIAKEKGWALPKPAEMDEFLKNKGIPMPSSMDKTAVDTWLEMIRNCK